jgi:hypothetical protein
MVRLFSHKATPLSVGDKVKVKIKLNSHGSARHFTGDTFEAIGVITKHLGYLGYSVSLDDGFSYFGSKDIVASHKSLKLLGG